jgi:hypothetical protein
MRVVLPHFRFETLAFAFCVVFVAESILGAQQTADENPPIQAHVAPAPHPALLIYSQHPLPEEFWAALFMALHTNLPEVATRVPIPDANPEFLRGDNPASRDLKGEVAFVYLRGDCNPSTQNMQFPWGERLGWVNEVDGFIMPVIHVQCTQVGEAIAKRTQWMNRNERTAAMSEAIAQVILHEWVHVAAQSAAHRPDGVTKAAFGIDDLLCGNRTRNCGHDLVIDR